LKNATHTNTTYLYIYGHYFVISLIYYLSNIYKLFRNHNKRVDNTFSYHSNYVYLTWV
jgi:hypothetical protein